MTRLSPAGGELVVWGGQELPAGFIWQGDTHRIEAVLNHWQVHTLWWVPDKAVWREYLKVITDTGFICQLYRDLPGASWFLARIYD